MSACEHGSVHLDFSIEVHEDMPPPIRHVLAIVGVCADCSARVRWRGAATAATQVSRPVPFPLGPRASLDDLEIRIPVSFDGLRC